MYGVLMTLRLVLGEIDLTAVAQSGAKASEQWRGLIGELLARCSVCESSFAPAVLLEFTILLRLKPNICAIQPHLSGVYFLAVTTNYHTESLPYRYPY
jgi:hypothetical protein